MTKLPDDMYEKMLLAVKCLCGSGSFERRLDNATVTALVGLMDHEVEGELAEDFRFILEHTTGNIENKRLSAETQQEIADKMLRILCEAHKQYVLQYPR